MKLGDLRRENQQLPARQRGGSSQRCPSYRPLPVKATVSKARGRPSARLCQLQHSAGQPGDFPRKRWPFVLRFGDGRRDLQDAGFAVGIRETRRPIPDRAGFRASGSPLGGLQRTGSRRSGGAAPSSGERIAMRLGERSIAPEDPGSWTGVGKVVWKGIR